VCIPLAIITLLSTAFIALGVGFVLAPASLAGVRGLARLQRRWAARWSGVEIPEPYRPVPVNAHGAAAGAAARHVAVLTDPASWRDLLWTVANVPVGLVLGLLPVCLLGYGLEGVFGAPWALGIDAAAPVWWVISFVTGAAALALEPYLGPRALRAHALFTASLLGPSRAEPAERDRQLAEAKGQLREEAATELRRIERDLHDGAQARLAAVGAHIGLAEQLLRTDPETAAELLAEARLSSGQAMADLRSLLRGIHPPVLAERGLADAVRALADALPLPVDVSFDPAVSLPPAQQTALYFAIAESLANIAKHSGATRAWVQVHRRPDATVLAVVGDNGVGGADPSGDGLRGVERRLAAFAGVFAVTSPVGGPTSVVMELPGIS
jgi:signal transduction histidine kinase